MTLQKREKILAAIVGGLVLLLIGSFLWSAWRAPLDALAEKRDGLQTQVEEMESRLAKSRKARARMEQWNKRSLPSDTETARTDYQAWLLKLAEDEVRFSGTRVDTGDAGEQRGIYRALSFSLKAEGTLQQLVEFLFHFDSAGHLHQIRTVTIKPLKGSANLNFTINIEALCLAGARAKGKLSDEPSLWLAGADLDQYRKPIVERKLFAAYSPPPPERPDIEPRPKPEFDPGKYAFLSGIATGEDGDLKVWLQSRTDGQLSILREGESFELADLRGKVLQINRLEAEIEIDGQRWLWPLGDNLREMVKLSEPGETPTPPDAAEQADRPGVEPGRPGPSAPSAASAAGAAEQAREGEPRAPGPEPSTASAAPHVVGQPDQPHPEIEAPVLSESPSTSAPEVAEEAIGFEVEAVEFVDEADSEMDAVEFIDVPEEPEEAEMEADDSQVAEEGEEAEEAETEEEAEAEEEAETEEEAEEAPEPGRYGSTSVP